MRTAKDSFVSRCKLLIWSSYIFAASWLLWGRVCSVHLLRINSTLKHTHTHTLAKKEEVSDT